MFKNYFAAIYIILIGSSVLANDYFKALDLFNKKMTEQAIIHFKKVAEDENHEKRGDAMFNIALIYDNGFGVKKNKSKAFDYYKLAAEKKHKIAQYNLAWMYYNGESIEKNFFEAFPMFL